jgi:hypothetical protein
LFVCLLNTGISSLYFKLAWYKLCELVFMDNVAD